MALIGGNHLELLVGGAAFFPALNAAIAAAQHDILLETYIFAPDRTGHAIAAALAAAAQRGVRVRLTVDGFGSRPFVEHMLDSLQARGVEIRVFRPEVRLLSLKRQRLRRLHRKLVVIDGTIAFVGGINIVDDYTPNLQHPRHDYAVRIEGPIAGSVRSSMEHLWQLVSWAALRRERTPRPWRAVLPAVGHSRARFLIRDNLRHRHEIENAYLRAIRHAREEILIANAYFIPGRRFRRALVDAAQRGVRVTLLLQGLSEHLLVREAGRALYPYFLSHGIRIFEYRRSFLHAKVAVVDAHWATVGSSNIDPFSLLLAREANLEVYDRSFASQLHSHLSAAMDEGAVPLDPVQWQPRARRLQRILEWGAYQLVRVLLGLAGFNDRR